MTKNNKKIAALGLLLPLTLTGCQSMESLLSDSGMRQDTPSAVVVNPVPRSQVSKSAVQASATNQTTATQVTTPAPSAVPTVTGTSSSSGSHIPSTSTGAAVVPNVAPSLGE